MYVGPYLKIHSVKQQTFEDYIISNWIKQSDFDLKRLGQMTWNISWGFLTYFGLYEDILDDDYAAVLVRLFYWNLFLSWQTLDSYILKVCVN